jgi:hypothetical protein
VTERDEYSKYLSAATSDLEEEAEHIALDELTAGLYFDAEPDEADLEKLKGLNLVGMLEKEIADDIWDMGRIKVLFRALKVAKPEEGIDLITQRFEDLAIFGKELVLLMEVLEGDNLCCFDELEERVTEAILSPPASSIEIIRTWLLEIFVRNIITISSAKLKKLEALPTVIDKKQLLLIRGRCKDVNYFRRQKTAVQSFSDIERPYLVWGASCLPQDEYEVWIHKTVGVHMNKPLDGLFLKWAAKNRSRLMLKLKAPIVEHPE